MGSERRRRGAGRRDEPDRLPLGSNIPVPVGFQVLIGVGTLVVLLVASLVLAIVLIVALSHQDRKLSTHRVPYATALDEAALAAKGAANDSRGFLISGNPLYVEEFGRRVGEVREALTNASRHATTEPELTRASEARAQFDRWVGVAQREFRLFVADRRHAAVSASLGPDRDLRKRYEASLATAAQLARKDIRAAETSYAGASRRAVTLLLIFLLASIGVGLAVTVWVVRKILEPVYAVLRLFGDLEAGSSDAVQTREMPETS